jgi:hypothetical protein
MGMKRLCLAAAVTVCFLGCAVQPVAVGTGTQAGVTAAAEQLRIAMIDPSGPALSDLVADDLSYGHSSGRVDTKASFIADLLSGASDFVNITISDQTIKVVDGNTAIVRHTLTADTADGGKPGKVALKILAVWQVQNGHWRLLARQAVRV